MTTFDQDTLLKLVRPHLGISSGHPDFTPIQTGKHNRSYWINWASDRFVLRISPPDDAGFLFYERLMMRQEPGLHKLIRERTTIPVSEVIAYDFSREVIDRDYLLMRALPGTPMSETKNPSPGLFSRALEQVGDYLSQLHTLTASDCLNLTAFGYLGEHHPMNPQPTWAAAFKVMWNMLLDDVVACGTYTPVEAQIIRDLFEHYREHFDQPVIPRLLHMDVWSQNILLDDQGNVTGLVDFDRALWGDIEIEFAVLDYCGISEPPFWAGYGSERDTSPSARIRQQFYLLYELQKYMPIRVWRRNDPAAAERYKEQSLTMIRRLITEA